MKALFFLAALAIVGLVLTGAIKLQRTNQKVSIEIDRQQVAEDARHVVEEGREILEDIREAFDDDQETNRR